MSTQPAPAEIPNANYDPYRAAAWLIARHPHASGLVDRLSAWADRGPDAEIAVPDLRGIAEGIVAYDKWRDAWESYADANPAPRSPRAYESEQAYERAYDNWEARGPQIENPFARGYAPMSSGEKRFYRLLAVLDNRIRFSLDDIGVSLQCCQPPIWGAPRPHRPFVEDWAELITKAVEQ